MKKSLVNSFSALLLITVSTLILTGAKDPNPYKPLTQSTFIDVTKNVQPSVVSIKVSAVDEARMQQFKKFHENLPNDPLYRFFGPLNPQQPLDEDAFRTQQAGSGVIIRKDGYVVTNRHVIQSASEGDLTITLHDGREYSGSEVKIIGMDELTDIAVLKVDDKNLPHAKWADSDELEIGQWVLAMGDPLELRNSVTQGIVSGLGRDIESFIIRNFIQTTAVINPGNSGGALVTLDNKIAGINMLISTRNGYWQGVGFAIPANIAKRVTDDIIHRGKVVRGYVGISMRPLVSEIKKHMNYDGNGVWVYGLNSNGPAHESGVEVNDIIVEIDGVEITDTRSMLQEVADKKVGKSANFKIYRNDEYINIPVKIGERPSDEVLAAYSRDAQYQKVPSPAPTKYKLGIQASAVPNIRLGESDNYSLEVINIQKGSLAEKAGIQIGDLIYEVNGKRVKTLDELQQALEQRDDQALIKLHRGNSGEFVIIKFIE